MPHCGRHSFVPHEEPVDRMLTSHPLKLSFLITPTKGTPLCMVVQTKQDRCTYITQEKQTLVGSETEETPQSVTCPPLAQHQIGETPLGWVNRKCCESWIFLSKTEHLICSKTSFCQISVMASFGLGKMFF